MQKVQTSFSILRVNDLEFKKCALVLHLALQQFIADNGIPMVLISDINQAENISAKWIQLCSKYKIMQSSLEPYKQNQNYVEHWIQEAKITESQIKLHTGYDDQYIYDMWAHISNDNNHYARKSLKWHTPLVFSVETPYFSIFRNAFYALVWYREWC